MLAYNRLIEGIYGLALKQDGLQSLLDMLAEVFHCRAIGVQVVAKLDWHVVSEVSSQVGEDDMADFLVSFSALKPFLQVVVDIAAETAAGEVYLFSGGGLTRLDYGVAILPAVLAGTKRSFDLLFREGDYFIQVVLRYDDQLPADFHHLMHTVNLVMPHVRKSFSIYFELERDRSYAAGFEQALEHLSSGLLLFNGHGDLCYQNNRAREMIGETHAISLISGKMYGATPEYTRAIRQAIRDTIVRAKRNDRNIQVMLLHNGMKGERELPVVAIPIVLSMRKTTEKDSGIFAALLIGSGGLAGSIEPEVLQLLYGLTNAEARLAACIADGNSLGQCSACLGVTVTTARSYLKQVFLKTSTRRQAELVALVKGIPVLRPRNDSDGPDCHS
ncbi:helix-turn-helix transcriptional regulator [Mariprofundus erugo]|uniref:Helix-turn-helix transcriptional regulator n=1 Tax=Mariprofundus erugo TaxID=2528639 RepID=A0A5R9GJJ5_9PROT|nr:helix-turn-helix transcriptional regulator [Mariprofundus erugo]TLS65259.1 helix-turn-helix transcriptional regulator [Mariprofundus erugo]